MCKYSCYWFETEQRILTCLWLLPIEFNESAGVQSQKHDQELLAVKVKRTSNNTTLIIKITEVWISTLKIARKKRS